MFTISNMLAIQQNLLENLVIIAQANLRCFRFSHKVEKCNPIQSFFHWPSNSEYEMLWYSAFNAQGWRLVIVVVELGAVKKYVATMEALRKKERQDETQFTTKIDGFLSSIPPWMLLYFFGGFFILKSHLVYDQSQGSGAVFLVLHG